MAEATAKKPTKTTKMAKVYIPMDILNTNDKEIYMQRDGVTIAIKRGEFVPVPLWAAERLKEIGDITDYEVVEVVGE